MIYLIVGVLLVASVHCTHMRWHPSLLDLVSLVLLWPVAVACWVWDRSVNDYSR